MVVQFHEKSSRSHVHGGNADILGWIPAWATSTEYMSLQNSLPIVFYMQFLFYQQGEPVEPYDSAAVGGEHMAWLGQAMF